MADILELVGKRIRDIRKTKNLSQEQLGEKSGFHFSYIGGLERGERNISLVNLAKIAKALEVSIHELLKFEYELSEEKQASIEEIVLLLSSRNERQVEMAKNVLTEIFNTFKDS
ncbi:helix-turn-helix transcriptional regulator [Bacillota bacterium LX-D]|nr:helix-turn-helix transcriptional regulator [Bacillota bacterium LX-D]